MKFYVTTTATVTVSTVVEATNADEAAEIAMTRDVCEFRTIPLRLSDRENVRRQEWVRVDDMVPPFLNEADIEVSECKE